MKFVSTINALLQKAYRDFWYSKKWAAPGDPQNPKKPPPKLSIDFQQKFSWILCGIYLITTPELKKNLLQKVVQLNQNFVQQHFNEYLHVYDINIS